MKILVTGSNGMLGSDLVYELCGHHDVFGLSRRGGKKYGTRFYEADVTKPDAILDIFSDIKPEMVVHTAAYTDVDGCERNPEQAVSVNTDGTRSVAKACSTIGATLFFISTDYVFDGNKMEPYDEEDVPKPMNTYGRSKRDAETFLQSAPICAYVIRTSWLFGENGKNFFRSIVQKVARGEKLEVVDDQQGAPTYTKDVAKALRPVLEQLEHDRRQSGSRVYHLANCGRTTWFKAAERIVKKLGTEVEIERITSEELDRPAKRPRNSILNTTRIHHDFGIRMRSWEEAVDAYWHESLREEWEKLIKSHVN
ncbi:MAG: dTDP-4-dehydrorhamnose reductase [Omnitrophica bacterium RIFCSPLOWO2_12_FULL_50_11]|nr:MAG: dTDP-4-dehydrorhamnose reductase [Omnitrophica bacterium RIFCSPLOWO2_12_FULL_50_11]